jgi:DNA-binding response OmpR family regulator
MDKTTILIIEDNEGVRENLEKFLGLYGYTILAEPNGMAGVKTAIQHLPDLILCDVMMAEQDGYGVLNILSENDDTAGIPFIFTTSKIETEDICRGMNLGADDYITKPFHKDELLQVISTRLKKIGLSNGVTPVASAGQVHLSDPEGGLKRLEEAFEKKGHQHTLSEGGYIFREGENPHFIYRVEAGHVHLSRAHEHGHDYIIAELGAGEIFGVPSALERTPLHYSGIVGLGGTVLQSLAINELVKLLNTDRTVIEALMRLMAGRVVIRGDRLVNQAYDSVRRRTALVLCDLHEKYEGEAIELSREELAQMVGSTKESIIRSLSDFKQDGLLRSEGKRLILQDVEGLRGLLV